MKIKVNKDICSGHARCMTVAPEVFELDDFGYNRMDDTVVPPEKEAAARRGAAACPEKAISIVED